MQQGAAGGQCTFSNKTFCACNNNLDNRDPIFRGTDEFLIILIFADNKCHHLEALLLKLAKYILLNILCPSEELSVWQQTEWLLIDYCNCFCPRNVSRHRGSHNQVCPRQFSAHILHLAKWKELQEIFVCVRQNNSIRLPLNTKPKTAAVALNCKTKMAF